jgi:hypothetical protein
VNIHDNLLFDRSFTELLDGMDRIGISLVGSFLTFDSGFDDGKNRNQILSENLIPVIKPNMRGLKNREKIEMKLALFEEVREVYAERYKIERCFAWEDSYRKLVIRYETLQCTFMGFRYLAYSMMNLRDVFGRG